MFTIAIPNFFPPSFCFPCPQLVLSLSLVRVSALLEKLWCRLRPPMASSSERGAARPPGAAPPPLPPPPPEEVAAFYALVEKETTASVLCRYTRAAELAERATRQAERLWGDNNSLVVADLRVGEAASLRGMANASTSFSEKEALWRRAWAILVPVHALLLRRLADNTLLPGAIKEEEVTYCARTQAFTYKAMDKPVPPAASFQGLGVFLGYETLMRAAFQTLNLLIVLSRLWAAAGKCALLCIDGVGHHPTNCSDKHQNRK